MAFLALLAAVLILGRPWLEALRPSLLVGLVAGAALGALAGDALTAEAATSLAALPAGWLALAAAEAWSLPRHAGVWRLPLLLLPPAIAGAALLRSGDPYAPAFALMAALSCSALDPAGAREALRRDPHPGETARITPSVIAFLLGMAILTAALPPALLAHDPASIALRMAAPLAIGLSSGAILAGLLRLAQGKGMILTLLAAAVLAVSGLARATGASALAALFLCGAVITRDAARRDLVSSLLRELERPAAVALMLLAGASLASLRETYAVTLLYGAAALTGLAAPILWRLLPFVPQVRRVMPLPPSPLAAALAMEALSWNAPRSGALGHGLLIGAGLAEALALAGSGIRRLGGRRG